MKKLRFLLASHFRKSGGSIDYRATAGQTSAPGFLTVDWVLASFGKRKSVAVKKYIQFVSAGKGQPSHWESVRIQVYLGSDEFFEEMQLEIDNDQDLSDVPLSQRRQLLKALYYYEHKYLDRNLAICNAYQSGGYTLKEIGEHFGLHYSTVSGVIKHHKSKT